MHPSLSHVDHRPWPLPTRRWAWRQSWCDLLFAHYPIPPDTVRPLVPEPLTVETWDGVTYVAVVPFRMEGVMLRPLPDLPGISAFPELNVRLYVRHDERPGVWFLSLDADNALAVWAARRFFHLPYVRASMSLTPKGDHVEYRSSRAPTPKATFRATYGPTSTPYRASPGTLEHALTERYCLYASAPDGALTRTEVHHEPWPLQKAEAAFEENGMLSIHGLSAPEPPALLHFARRIDVVAWNPERIT